MIVNTGTARMAPGTPHIQYLKLREKDDRHWVYRESVREQQTLGFENSAVYQDAGDAFAAAQRSIVAPSPAQCTATSTAASTCSERSSATRLSA
jgi:hypothetical protein